MELNFAVECIVALEVRSDEREDFFFFGDEERRDIP
jgi:hypothetical protein